MGRVLVVVLLVVLAVWLLRRALRRSAPPAPGGTQKPLSGNLVSCARCGLNLPRDEARKIGADLYCSEEHAHLGRKDINSGRS